MDNSVKKMIYTKLKFMKSEETGAYIGFVSQNSKTGKIAGVRQDSEYPKKICIVDKNLACQVVPNILYDVSLIPMKDKNGYIAIEITPVSFEAKMETTYVQKAIYKIEIKFGNKTILFDPLDGKKNSTRTLPGVREVLEKRMDIRNIQQVVEDFLEAARTLMKHYEGDGVALRRPRR